MCSTRPEQCVSHLCSIQEARGSMQAVTAPMVSRERTTGSGWSSSAWTTSRMSQYLEEGEGQQSRWTRSSRLVCYVSPWWQQQQQADLHPGGTLLFQQGWHKVVKSRHWEGATAVCCVQYIPVEAVRFNIIVMILFTSVIVVIPIIILKILVLIFITSSVLSWTSAGSSTASLCGFLPTHWWCWWPADRKNAQKNITSSCNGVSIKCEEQ